VTMLLQAATGPSWWVDRGVVSTNAVPNDFAAINQGQLKWMAANVAAELEENLPGGAGSNVWALIDSFSNTNNYRPVNLGQLKYVAKPFYDRLIEVGYTTNYPWSGQPNDYALANIGQMKNVFSFDVATWMTQDTDEDRIPDWWMFHNFGHATGQSNDLSRAEDDADGDGSSNMEEYLASSNPQSATSYPSDNPIKNALDTFNYAQVNLLRAVTELTPTEWSYTTDLAARIGQLRTSIGELVPNFLDLSVGLGSTNVVVKWTLVTVLSSVGNTNGTWRGGLASVEQVNELRDVLGQLTLLPSSEGTLQEGVEDQISWDTEEWPYSFQTWGSVSLSYPAAWPTNWTINTYAFFTTSRDSNTIQVLDDAFTLNGNTNDYFHATGNSYLADITGGWLPNQTNELKAWDEIWMRLYCSPFRILHVLEVPTVRVQFSGDVYGGYDDWTGFQSGGDQRVWLSVPQGGVNTITVTVTTSDVLTNITFDTDDAGIATASPSCITNASQVLTVTGTTSDNAIHDTCVNVKLNGMKIASFHADVLPKYELIINVTFDVFNITALNDPGTQPTQAAPWWALMDKFHTTFGRQANIWFTAIDTNKMSEVNYDVDGRNHVLDCVGGVFSDEENIIRNAKPSEAFSRIFFVHSIKQFRSDVLRFCETFATPILGHAPWGERTCFVGDGVAPKYLSGYSTSEYIVAHEMGHAFASLRHTDGKDPKRLMCEGGVAEDDSSIRLVRDEWEALNRAARGGWE